MRIIRIRRRSARIRNFRNLRERQSRDQRVDNRNPSRRRNQDAENNRNLSRTEATRQIARDLETLGSRLDQVQLELEDLETPRESLGSVDHYVERLEPVIRVERYRSDRRSENNLLRYNNFLRSIRARAQGRSEVLTASEPSVASPPGGVNQISNQPVEAPGFRRSPPQALQNVPNNRPESIRERIMRFRQELEDRHQVREAGRSRLRTHSSHIAPRMSLGGTLPPRFDADSEISLVTPRVGSQNISQFQPGAPTQPVSPPSSRRSRGSQVSNSVRFSPYATPVVSLPRIESRPRNRTGHQPYGMNPPWVPGGLRLNDEINMTETGQVRLGPVSNNSERHEWSRVIEDNFFRDVFSFDIFGHSRPQTGMTKAEIEAIPRKNYRCLRSSRHESCHVCLLEFENGDKLNRLKKCGHEFHPDCLKPWLERHTTCPVCRQSALEMA